MSRTARAAVAHTGYHALNRGNRRAAVCHQPADDDAFVQAIADAHARLPVDRLGNGLMPNHCHLILRTHADGDLGRWMLGRLMAHARRDHRHDHTSGHVWQGRFQAFPIQDEDHLVTVRRYVERNALRGELESRAEDLEVVERAGVASRRLAAVAWRRGAGRALAGAGERADIERGLAASEGVGGAGPAGWGRVVDAGDGATTGAGVQLERPGATEEGRVIRCVPFSCRPLFLS